MEYESKSCSWRLFTSLPSTFTLCKKECCVLINSYLLLSKTLKNICLTAEPGSWQNSLHWRKPGWGFCGMCDWYQLQWSWWCKFCCWIWQFYWKACIASNPEQNGVLIPAMNLCLQMRGSWISCCGRHVGMPSTVYVGMPHLLSGRLAVLGFHWTKHLEILDTGADGRGLREH